MSKRKIDRCKMAYNVSDEPYRETIAECQYPAWCDGRFKSTVYVMDSDCRKCKCFQESK